MKICVISFFLLSTVHDLCNADKDASNTDIITVIRNMQKDLQKLTQYVHAELEKRMEVIEKAIQDAKIEAGYFTKKLITADDVISAKSSSVWCGNSDLWGPQYAWKGRSATSTHFFHSADELNPWLVIHIPRVQLYSVTIINRKDGGGEELHNIEVRAGLLEGLGNEVVGIFKGPGETGKEHTIPFNRGAAVEYISFQKIGKGRLMINGIKVNESQ